jgi:hypothetical protein
MLYIIITKPFTKTDLTLVDRYPTDDTDTDLDDRPPTPTQQRQVCFKVKAR